MTLRIWGYIEWFLPWGRGIDDPGGLGPDIEFIRIGDRVTARRGPFNWVGFTSKNMQADEALYVEADESCESA